MTSATSLAIGSAVLLSTLAVATDELEEQQEQADAPQTEGVENLDCAAETSSDR